MNSVYPRLLSAWEQEIIGWLLPAESRGYNGLREFALQSKVIGEGRWGTHDLVLAHQATEIDRTAPMLPVVASGEIEYAEGTIAISVHERSVEDQVEIEITQSFAGEERNEKLHEHGRWCYSYWKPGDVAPRSGSRVREISFENSRGENIEGVVAIASADKVLWLHDASEKTNRLIPVTNFYNQLMLARQERNPKIALDHARLFTHTDEFSDREILHAFVQYNRTFRKIDPTRVREINITPKQSWWKKFF